MMWLYAVAIAAGIALAAQVGINAQLGERTNPMFAAFVSFASGTLVLAAYVVSARNPWPTSGMLAAVPWWAWLGGTLGVFYVVAVVVSAPRIGAGVMVALAIGAWTLAAVAIDAFGWLGFAQHPVTLPRALGAVLLIAGVALIRFF